MATSTSGRAAAASAGLPRPAGRPTSYEDLRHEGRGRDVGARQEAAIESGEFRRPAQGGSSPTWSTASSSIGRRSSDRPERPPAIRWRA